MRAHGGRHSGEPVRMEHNDVGRRLHRVRVRERVPRQRGMVGEDNGPRRGPIVVCAGLGHGRRRVGHGTERPGLRKARAQRRLRVGVLQARRRKEQRHHREGRGRHRRARLGHLHVREDRTRRVRGVLRRRREPHVLQAREHARCGPDVRGQDGNRGLRGRGRRLVHRDRRRAVGWSRRRDRVGDRGGCRRLARLDRLLVQRRLKTEKREPRRPRHLANHLHGRHVRRLLVP